MYADALVVGAWVGVNLLHQRVDSGAAGSAQARPSVTCATPSTGGRSKPIPTRATTAMSDAATLRVQYIAEMHSDTDHVE